MQTTAEIVKFFITDGWTPSIGKTIPACELLSSPNVPKEVFEYVFSFYKKGARDTETTIGAKNPFWECAYNPIFPVELMEKVVHELTVDNPGDEFNQVTNCIIWNPNCPVSLLDWIVREFGQERGYTIQFNAVTTGRCSDSALFAMIDSWNGISNIDSLRAISDLDNPSNPLCDKVLMRSVMRNGAQDFFVKYGKGSTKARLQYKIQTGQHPHQYDRNRIGNSQTSFQSKESDMPQSPPSFKSFLGK